MPPQARLGDKALIPADAHGCPACPHTATGPAVAGSRNVLVNDRPAIRVGDPGIHAACCGPNTWNAKTGSASVLINGRKAHRHGDSVQHCGGSGSTISGSPNVVVGDYTTGQSWTKPDALNTSKNWISVAVVDNQGQVIPYQIINLGHTGEELCSFSTSESGIVHNELMEDQREMDVTIAYHDISSITLIQSK